MRPAVRSSRYQLLTSSPEIQNPNPRWSAHPKPETNTGMADFKRRRLLGQVDEVVVLFSPSNLFEISFRKKKQKKNKKDEETKKRQPFCYSAIQGPFYLGSILPYHVRTFGYAEPKETNLKIHEPGGLVELNGRLIVGDHMPRIAGESSRNQDSGLEGKILPRLGL